MYGYGNAYTDFMLRHCSQNLGNELVLLPVGGDTFRMALSIHVILSCHSDTTYYFYILEITCENLEVFC